MEARVVNNLSPAAAHDGAVRCLLAIELSKKSWVVAVKRRTFPRWPTNQTSIPIISIRRRILSRTSAT